MIRCYYGVSHSSIHESVDAFCVADPQFTSDWPCEACVDPVCRFLRARKFDVPKAKAMLLAAEQWRLDMKIDDIVQSVACLLLSVDYPDLAQRRNFDFAEKKEVDQYYPQYYHKMDKVAVISFRPFFH
jgi:hypothetical protein